MYKLIAHRGDKESSKENTLAAFFDALKKDYKGFECDVRQNKDKDLYVYHDPLYNGKIFRSISSKELDKAKVLKLKDVLEIDTHKIIMLDIKDPFIDSDKLINLIESYPDKNIYVMSFYDKVINSMWRENRSYKLGILNYVLNTNDNHFKYDFLCILNAIKNENIVSKYENNNKELFIYGVSKESLSDLYPYYIVD